MRKIKTAVIGAGFMGKAHTEAIHRLGNVDVVAIAAAPASDAARLGRAFDIPHTTGVWKSLVDDPKIEAVHICTPNALHAPMAKAFAAAGKHVLCEKPMALSEGEGKEMLEIATRNKVVHCINHNLRYYPLVQQIRRMI